MNKLIQLFLSICLLAISCGDVYASPNNACSMLATKQNLSGLSLDKPGVDDATVSCFARAAVKASLTYDYEHYQRSLLQAKKYYTLYGWQEFMRALKASNNLEAVKAKKLRVITHITGKASIKKSGVSKGVYQWALEFPIRTQYVDLNNKVYTVNDIALVGLTRTNEKETAGIGVWQLVIRPPSDRSGL